jgi:colanic acid/amylovoran biosynthesis glycosyltransferase
MTRDSSPPLKIAIATGRYLRPGETFVSRHISELFQGNTVVVAGRRQHEPPQEPPAFFRGREAMNLRDLASAPWYLWRHHREYSSLRIPFGYHGRKLRRFLQEHEVQAILCEFGSQGPPMVPLGNSMGIPVFCYFRGKDATEALRRKRRVAAYRKMFAGLSGVFAVSRFLLDNLAKLGLCHSRSFVVPSGVDIETFRPHSKTPKLIIAVGRFVEKKAPQITVEAFLSLADKHPDARLEMIGDGPLLARCRNLVAKAGRTKQVVLHGRKPHRFVCERMGAAEVFVQHSLTAKNGEAEGLPSSIQEAMACGAAILSTRHAGIPAAVQEGVTGLLAEESDQEGFTKKLNDLLDDAPLRHAMSRSARQYAVQHFDYRVLYQIVEEQIRAIVEDQKPIASPVTP